MNGDLRPVWADVNHWELRQLYEAHRIVDKYDYTSDEVVQMYAHAEQIRLWLNAEAHWQQNIKRWLTEEKAWHVRRALLSGDPAYAAAERGWLAMREISPNLDGVDAFDQLSPILQDRYAVFAKAALAAPVI